MEHFILAVYFLLFASGFVGIAALAAMGLRLRTRLIGDFLVILVLYIAGLSIVLIYYYLGNIVVLGGRDLSGPLEALAVLSTLVQTGLYAFAAHMVGRLKTGGRFKPLFRRTTIGLCIYIAAVSLIRAVSHILPGAALPSLPVGPAAASALGYLPVVAAIVLLGLSLLWAPLPGEHGALRLLARGWALALFSFIPLTVAEWALDSFGNAAYEPLSLDFLFYFGLNAVSIAAFVRSLRNDPVPGETALRFTVGEDTAARFGLTFRERDMVPLIAKGLANKEIAAELGISAATVRTHIYNLFQKVGAKSRIELLNKLKD